MVAKRRALDAFSSQSRTATLSQGGIRGASGGLKSLIALRDLGFEPCILIDSM
jgi:hypothetical protein